MEKKKPVAASKAAIKPKKQQPLKAEAGLQQRQGKSKLTKLGQLEGEIRQYADLYDLAPVGYFTLTRNGVVHQVNLAGAKLLGMHPKEATQFRLAAFISSDSRSDFKVFFEELLLGVGKKTCELKILQNEIGVFWAHLEAACFEGGDICRVMMTDITDRKNMEQALQESEKRFRILLQDVSSIAVQGYGMDGTTQYWNTASERLYGYSAQEAVGRSLLELIIPPEMRDGVRQAIKQMAETGQPIPAAELSLMRKDGSRVAVYSCHAIVSIPGRGPELFCLDLDLTDRKRTEELRKESEWRNRIVSELTTDYIFVVDVDPSGILKLRWASENMFRLTGRKIEDAATSDMWGNIIHPDDRALFFGYVSQILSTQEAGEFECRTFYKDGAERWVRIFARPQLGDGNTVTTIVGAIEDITERRQVDKALRESEERFRSLYENATIGIYRTTPDGRILLANPSLVKMLGYQSFEELAQRDLNNGGNESSYPRQEFKERIEKEENIHGLETAWTRKDGSMIFIRESARLVRDENNQPLYYDGTVEDITERKKMEDALRENQELFSLFLRHSPIYAFIKEVTPGESRVLRASENYQNMIGIKGSEMVGKTMEELFPAEAAAKFTADDWAVVTGGKVLKLDEDLNGRYYTTIKFPIVQGDKTLLAGYTIDITERQRAEMELQFTKESLKAANTELQVALLRHQELAHTDALTGINNRRHLFELGEREFNIAVRYQHSMSVIMFDIDHFKKVNDTFGHAVGDQMLQLVTQVARAELRSADVIGRYGGEEFVIILPLTNARQAYPLAERIRQRVEAVRVPTVKGDATVTLSIGIVETFDGMQAESIEKMINAADEVMYAAKQAGRNRTEIG